MAFSVRFSIKMLYFHVIVSRNSYVEKSFSLGVGFRRSTTEMGSSDSGAGAELERERVGAAHLWI
jgi:hypothetical protein